jgi:hypothetical protein
MTDSERIALLESALWRVLDIISDDAEASGRTHVRRAIREIRELLRPSAPAPEPTEAS